MSTTHHPRPVINERKPDSKKQELFGTKKPTETAWLSTFKRAFKTASTRYTFIWLSAALVFGLWMKPVTKKYEKQLMIEDIDNYLENKRKKNEST